MSEMITCPKCDHNFFYDAAMELPVPSELNEEITVEASIDRGVETLSQTGNE
jgi:hypothetical protein